MRPETSFSVFVPPFLSAAFSVVFSVVFFFLSDSFSVASVVVLPAVPAEDVLPADVPPVFLVPAPEPDTRFTFFVLPVVFLFVPPVLFASVLFVLLLQ